MKRLLSLVAFFATLQASAQQVNPVPDYVFANRMSAGRNTVTDTAAYFSIGPRYGATRGMMPPMVVDTASFSGNKRNGLLIFSVQKNKFLYWDSVGVKWAEMAGTAGTALTSADTAALLSTRAWRQKGIDSLAAIRIAGSGTTNYVPKFTAGTTIGNSQVFDNGTNVGVGTASPISKLDVNGAISSSNGYFTNGRTISSGSVGFALEMGVQKSGADSNTAIIGNINRNSTPIFGVMSLQFDSLGFNRRGSTIINFGRNIVLGTSTNRYVGSIKIDSSSSNIFFNLDSTITTTNRRTIFFNSTNNAANFDLLTNGNNAARFGFDITASAYVEIGSLASWPLIFIVGGSERARINTSSELLVATSTDAGDYKLQVSGNIYNTGSITTGAPSGGSIKPWKIGEAATVSPTSPNRTIRVEIDGTVYYIHAKTTND